MNLRQAALDALHRIVTKYDSFVGTVITVASDGNFGAACHNINNFPYVATADDPQKRLQFLAQRQSRIFCPCLKLLGEGNNIDECCR